MSARKDRCVMDGCTNEVGHKHSGLCKACYAFMFYWKGRSVTDKMKHAQKIERWNKRASSALMPAKVTSIAKRRKSHGS